MNIQSKNHSTPSNTAVTAAKYLPTPTLAQQGVSGTFRDALRALGNIGKTVIGGVSTLPNGDFADLLNLQIQAQREMQSTTMMSNIERSKHESKMAAIRNIRVG